MDKRVDLTTEDGLRLDALWRDSGDRTVILAHGLTFDLAENGLFDRLAETLAQRGLSTLRFSFRGHGGSDGRDRDMTIAGELLDLRAAIAFARGPVSVLGSGFGAVSVALSSPVVEEALGTIVLWQPVLDLRNTFLEPDLPTGRRLFGGHETDPRNLCDRFTLGAPLFVEFAVHRPIDAFLSTSVPALVIHGDADSLVSHDIARDTAQRRWGTQWHSVPGAEHGFPGADMSSHVIETTADWLSANG